MPGRTRRSTRVRLGATAAAVVLAAAFSPAAADAAATRTWVSGVGDDINPCSRTAPCKTLAGAISKTAPRGEINAMDPGSFGTVTITKAITIDLSDAYGNVLNTVGTNGIVVDAGPDDDVVLRGIHVNGTSGEFGSPACPVATGVNGIVLRQARSLVVQDSTIQQQTTAGLQLSPAASGARVVLDDVTVSGACGSGVLAAPGAGQTLDLTVRDSLLTGNATALSVAGGAHAWLSGTTITGNGTGVATSDGGVIDSWWGSNQIVGNDDDGEVTNVLGAPPAPNPTIVVNPTPVTVTAPAPVPTPAPTAGPSAPAAPSAASKTCVVPKLTGLTQAAAATRLARAGCKLGRVTRRRAAAAQLGRVVAQQQKAGTRTAAGAKVNVTIGRR